MPVIGGAPGRGPGLARFRSTALSSVTPSPGIEWDVFQMLPGAAAPVLLATLYEAREKTIRVELNGPGSGQFAINRSSPECTETILAEGNLVKVRIPEIAAGHIFAFFLETGDYTLVSSDETGGEMLTFGGRGILAYTEHAIAWSESFVTGGQDPIDNIWRAYLAGTGKKPGQILNRMLEEMRHADRPQQPLPHLTADFGYGADSSGATWISTDATNEFSYQVGESGLDIISRLLPTGIVVQMGADFDLHAYNPDTYGRDLSGAAFGGNTVRFVRGTNIAIELRRERIPTESTTHILVAGEMDHFGRAVLSDADDQVTKEGYLAAFGTGSRALSGLGRAALLDRQRTKQIVMFPIANRRTDVDLADPITVGATIGPVATDGFYLPGPAGTNGNFWLGDIVRLHTGSGPFDYNEADFQVKAITITREDDNHELIVIPELEEAVAACPAPTVSGFFGPLNDNGVNGKIPNLSPGNVFYLRPGIAYPTVYTPGHQGFWHFPTMGTGGAPDYAGNCTQSRVRCLVVGDGTITIHTAATAGSRTLTAWLMHKIPGVVDIVDEVHTGIATGSDIVFQVSTHGQEFCTHYVDVLDFGTVCGGGAGQLGFAGFDWVAA